MRCTVGTQYEFCEFMYSYWKWVTKLEQRRRHDQSHEMRNELVVQEKYGFPLCSNLKEIAPVDLWLVYNILTHSPTIKE